MASQITSILTICSTVYSGAHQRKHQSSVLLAVVRGIHRSLVDSPHKGSATRKMFPFDDAIMPKDFPRASHIQAYNVYYPDYHVDSNTMYKL